MVRKWMYFEIQLMGFADTLEMGCERNRGQDSVKIFFFNLNNWKNGFSIYQVGEDFRGETRI